MKLLDYVKQLPIGAVVTNKRLLSVLKRKGLIFDYSCFGYLESCFIYYNVQYGGKTERYDMMLHLFTKGNAPRNYYMCKDGTKVLDSYIQLDCDGDELRETYGRDGVIEYKGNYFTMQYLDGCFSPYLVKCDEKGKLFTETLYVFVGSDLLTMWVGVYPLQLTVLLTKNIKL